MPRTLYEDSYRVNAAGAALSKEVTTALEPILDKYESLDYNLREIGCVIQDEVMVTLAERIILQQVRKQKEKRHVQS